jgi:hypothetical protein
MFQCNRKSTAGLLVGILLLITSHTASAGVLDKSVQVAIKTSARFMGWSVEETAARLATDPKARQVIVGTIRMLGLGKDAPELLSTELSPVMTRNLQEYSGTLLLGSNRLGLSNDALLASQQRFAAPIDDLRLGAASRQALLGLNRKGLVNIDELNSLYGTRPVVAPNPGLSAHTLPPPIDGSAKVGDALTSTNPLKKPTFYGASGLGALCANSQDVCFDWAKEWAKRSK